MPAPRDPSEHALPWPELRASIRRRLASHLRGWPAEAIEDATQDVVYKLLRFIERSGPPENPDGLAGVIARRTAVECIRARSRRPAFEPLRDESHPGTEESSPLELAELEDEVAWRAFQVIEFFRVHHSPCLELAAARSRGVDFKRFATETGQSHLALLQRWSRCMRRLREAIASGKVPWNGPEGGRP